MWQTKELNRVRAMKYSVILIGVEDHIFYIYIYMLVGDILAIQHNFWGLELGKLNRLLLFCERVHKS